MNGKSILFALVCGAAAGCAQPSEPPGPRFTKDQLEARFYYDLGSSELDVSNYPKAQQANYEVFKKTCSQCHTLARPINSPLVEKKDWERYVRRMRQRTQVRPGTAISKQDAKVIVDFLAYDARVRKVEKKAEFEARTKELQALFEEVQKERARLKSEEDRKKVKQAAPYTGTKP